MYTKTQKIIGIYFILFYFSLTKYGRDWLPTTFIHVKEKKLGFSV